MDHDGTASPLQPRPASRDPGPDPREAPTDSLEPLDTRAITPGRLTRLLEDLAAAPAVDLDSAPPLHAGDRLGRFLLVREIGKGGFGVVFEAEDTALRRRVAVKVVRPKAAMSAAGTTAARWLRPEAEAAAQLRHPNVVTLYDAGSWDGGTYLVYELLRGRTLAEALDAGPLARAEAVRVLRDLARALAHLHAAGVVHRDVKAANVFVDADGTVKLLDLGLSQIAGSAGHAAGSPPYAAPEQWRGERADARADVYAWGVLGHELLCGKLPEGPPPPGPQRLGSLRGLVAAARSEDPDLRPADGGALAAALDRIERRRARLRGARVAAVGLVLGAIAFLVARPTERQIARNVSTSLEAYQKYAAGRRCLERPSEGASWLRLDCGRHFREALAIDPDFPLAHFELAALARWDAHPDVEIAQALEPALQRIDRLPRREQAQLRAWKAELDGDAARSVQILRALSEEYPQDAQVAFGLGEAFYRQGLHADAVAPLERTVELDPGLELAADELVWSLGLLDRTDALRALADRMAASAPSPGTLHAEVQARGWIGDLDGALRVARRAAVGGGGAAREDLEDALVAAGQWDEAEQLLVEDVARGTERAPHRLESLLLLRGRFAEARALVARQPAPADGRLRFIAGSQRMHRLAATRDVVAMERIVDETRAWSPQLAAGFAPVLAYAGDAARAQALLPAVTEPGAREMTRALIAWRAVGAASALPQLRRLARADPAAVSSLPPEGPAWLAAECAAQADRAEAAIDDVHRFQRFYFPLGLWRAWAYPRSLVLEARLLAELGRPAEAVRALDRLDALWTRADPDLSLHVEARALRARIAAADFTAVRASGWRRP